MALPAMDAERRAATPCYRRSDCVKAAASPMLGQTDGRTLCRYIDPAPGSANKSTLCAWDRYFQTGVQCRQYTCIVPVGTESGA